MRGGGEGGERGLGDLFEKRKFNFQADDLLPLLIYFIIKCAP